jgi:hypothetical protein
MSVIFNFQFGLCVFAPKHPSEFGRAWLVAGHAESLRLCGAMLGACVGMTTRHHAKMEEGGCNREVGSGHTSISLDGLGGECERKHSDA